MKIWWTLQEIADLTGASRSTLEREIRDERLQVTKIRGSRRVRHANFVEWLGFDPLAESNVEVTISKTKKSKTNTTTTVTKIARRIQMSLFDND